MSTKGHDFYKSEEYRNNVSKALMKYWDNKKGDSNCIKIDNGYICIRMPSHPSCKCGRVYEHRVVMETKLGRYLKKEERIHHINGDRTDNRIENLMLFENDSEHAKFHTPKGSRVGINAV